MLARQQLEAREPVALAAVEPLVARELPLLPAALVDEAEVVQVPASGVAEDGDSHAMVSRTRDWSGSTIESDPKTFDEDVGSDLAEVVDSTGVDVEKPDHRRAEQVRIDLVEVMSGFGKDG